MEARENSLILHNKDNKDLFNLLSILYNKKYKISERKADAIKYDNENHMDKDVLMALAATADTKNMSYYKKIIENRIKKGENVICEVFEALKQEGIKQGWQEGRQEGQAEQIVKMSN